MFAHLLMIICLALILSWIVWKVIGKRLCNIIAPGTVSEADNSQARASLDELLKRQDELKNARKEVSAQEELLEIDKQLKEIEIKREQLERQVR